MGGIVEFAVEGEVVHIRAAIGGEEKITYLLR